MFVRVWEYDVVAGCEADFEEIYGSGGDWARLFATSDGFLGTELFKRIGEPTGYVTIDRFSSVHAWERFLTDKGSAYAALDQRTEGLTLSEQEVATTERA